MAKLKNQEIKKILIKRKGSFLCPDIYNFAKSNKKEFIYPSYNKHLNIRSSTYLKKFEDCIFKVHTGKIFVVNDIMDLKKVFKVYPFYNFKIGQFSYNKELVDRGFINSAALRAIGVDLKKKKGIFIKNNRKKKYIYKNL